MDAYYFGCLSPREKGHFLYDQNGRSRRSEAVGLPIRAEFLDGSLLFGVPDVPGNAVLFHGRGWTFLSFWDRSGDSRGASNSTFILRGTLSFEDAIEAAKAAFPQRWSLIKFDVTEYKDASNRITVNGVVQGKGG